MSELEKDRHPIFGLPTMYATTLGFPCTHRLGSKDVPMWCADYKSASDALSNLTGRNKPDPIADKLAEALEKIANPYAKHALPFLDEMEKIEIAKQALSEYQAMKGDV